MIKGTVYPARDEQIMEAYNAMELCRKNNEELEKERKSPTVNPFRESVMANIMPIPGRSQLQLVRGGTKEAQKIGKDRLAWFVIEINKEEFLICSI